MKSRLKATLALAGVLVAGVLTFTACNGKVTEVKVFPDDILLADRVLDDSKQYIRAAKHNQRSEVIDIDGNEIVPFHYDLI